MHRPSCAPAPGPPCQESALLRGHTDRSLAVVGGAVHTQQTCGPGAAEEAPRLVQLAGIPCNCGLQVVRQLLLRQPCVPGHGLQHPAIPGEQGRPLLSCLQVPGPRLQPASEVLCAVHAQARNQLCHLGAEGRAQAGAGCCSSVLQGLRQRQTCCLRICKGLAWLQGGQQRAHLHA